MLNSNVYVTILEMGLTRKFKKTVIARVERDPAFAEALLDEAATLFLSDEPETARVILRDLVNIGSGALRGHIREADGHALADRRRRLLNRL
jgi:hypothetical protein